MKSRLLILAGLLAANIGVLPAQNGIFITAGYVLAGERDAASWRLTVQTDLIGAIGADLYATTLPGQAGDDGELLGAGLDFTLFEGARRRPTIFIGGTVGAGSGDQDQLWYGGSIGMRLPLVVLGPIRSTIEARWRHMSVSGRDGAEFGVTLGWRRPVPSGRAAPPAGLYVPRVTADRLRASGIPDLKATVLSNVVNTALEEMGQPYVWGGTGDGEGGFDCSGLIYFAYGREGVRLPRTAQGQSSAGVAIRRELDALLPGDILTFAESGDRITHVGLYVGEGRFIHSASSGVRLSRLANDDPYGRYWMQRWIGVRRVIE